MATGSVKIAGISVPTYDKEVPWVPETNLVLTPTTLRNLQKILYPLRQGQNVLLVGDAGAGKNALIYYINQIRKHPTLRYSFNEDTLPEDLVGAYRIDPATHSFVWHDGPLAHAMRTGSTFVADEMNLAPPEVLKRFISVFTDGYLQILEGDASIIKAAPGFNFVATQNPAEGFEGRKNLPREIQKYFAAVYIDSYPESELVEILIGLYDSVPRSLVETLVRVNNRIEGELLQKKIGLKDLERYHFNLRNLNRLARRLLDDPLNPDSIPLEVFDIYLKPFRSDEDRQRVLTVFKEEIEKAASLDNPLASLAPDAEKHLRELQARNLGVEIQSARKSVGIGRARIGFSEEDRVSAEEFTKRADRALRRFPPVKTRLPVLESLARGIEKAENLLLESDADVEPEKYIEFFAEILGRKLTIITLSRGMHTTDILGGLKPVGGASMDDAGGISASVAWVDGPLTKAVREGDFVLLKGLEAAGPELVEKLNMLTDDTRALSLPPESGELEPVVLQPGARIFGLKYFRAQRSTPSISRAFRNRFSALIVPPIEDRESLREIVAVTLNLEESDSELSQLADSMVAFHTIVRDKARKRDIGANNLQPYRYGLTNLDRWCEHIRDSIMEEEVVQGGEGLDQLVKRGAAIAYINEISDPEEREKIAKLLDNQLGGLPLDDILSQLQTQLKKKLIEQRNFQGKVWWDPNEHWEKPDTEKAKRDLQAKDGKEERENQEAQDGQGDEGPDSWYGEDSQGEKGQGEPGEGGGGWGYRTEELYQEFLKKRKVLWEYNIGVTLEDFKEVFEKEIQRITINFDHLLDPRIDINRRYMSHGSRVDARRYLSYLAGRGDGRVFDKTTVDVEEDRLKGVEIVFAVNKGRRIFNFEYSIATLVSIMSSAGILVNHSIPFGVVGYSDLTNNKRSIDLGWYKELMVDYDPETEEQLFYGMARDWHGDTVAEYQILDGILDHFSPDARTRVVVIVSDFRGPRGKVTMEKDIAAPETYHLRESVETLMDRGVVLLGVGLGPRAIADVIFPEHLQVGGENYANLPALLAQKLTELIHRHHNPGL